MSAFNTHARAYPAVALLTVLVHPEAVDAFNDHAHYPLWLGQKLQLRLDWLARGNRSA